MQLSETTWRRLLTFFLVLGTLMQTLDSTIANVALPHMQGSLNASQDQIAWVVTSYVIGAAISMSLTSFLAERFGRKRMILAATVGFVLTSTLCASAQTIGQMVLYRALQGSCSAWIVPLSQAVLMEAYPRERGPQAISWWGMGSTLGPMIGPTLGGYITEQFNWRWVFLINLPIGLVAVAGLAWLVRETERQPRNYFDGLGFGFLAIGLTSLQLMLDRGQTQDWFDSREIIIEAIVAVVSLYLFFVHIFTTPQPFIRPKLYRDWNFCVGVLMLFFATAIPMSTMVLMPLMMQQVMGYPVQAVGWLMAPRGLGTLLAMWASVYMMRTLGVRLTLIVGLCIVILTLSMMSLFTVDTGETLLLLSGLGQGMGLGCVLMAINVTTLTSIDRRFLTEITSVANVVRSLGGSIGISVLVTLVSQNMQVVRAGLTESINPFSRSLQAMAGHPVLSNPLEQLAVISGEIDRQAAMTAYVDDFRLLLLMTCALLPMVLLFRKVARPAAEEHSLPAEA